MAAGPGSAGVFLLVTATRRSPPAGARSLSLVLTILNGRVVGDGTEE